MIRTLTIAALFCVTFTFAPCSMAEEHEENPTKLWRMVFYKIKPGGAERFWGDIEAHAKPMFGIGLRDGFITEYKIIKNPFWAGPDDWDVLIMLGYPDYAELDDLETNAARAYLEHFGTEEAAQESSAGRDDYREVLALRLVEQVASN